MTATPTKEVTVDEILPLPVKVEMWVMDLVDALQADYDRQGYSSDRYKFEATAVRKYWKICAKGQGVHAFIDKKTGQVYKPASWKAPAKHVRYDLRIINERNACLANADWAGGYLYMR